MLCVLEFFGQHDGPIDFVREPAVSPSDLHGDDDKFRDGAEGAG